MAQAAVLGLLVGGGYLNDLDAHGGALNAGVRYAFAPHAAVGFDLGYGLLAGPTGFQDRWWLMPTLSAVTRSGDVEVELGLGLGLGAGSGYTDGTDFAAAPFDPSWAFQLVPAARAHASVGVQVSPRVLLFLRLDAGALMLEGTTLGFRDRNPSPVLTDRLWVDLWAGARFGVW